MSGTLLRYSMFAWTHSNISVASDEDDRKLQICSRERLLQFETVESGSSHIQEIQENAAGSVEVAPVRGSLLPRRRSRFGSWRSAASGREPAVRLFSSTTNTDGASLLTMNL